MDIDTFRHLLGRFASGIAIITARDGHRDVGMTVSALCALSLSPPLILVCVDHKASMHNLLLRHPKLGISIIASEHEEHCRRFADRNETRRFEGIPFTRGESDVMLLDDAAAQLECQLVMHYDGGDHTIFVAQVERGSTGESHPLLHYRGRYAQLTN